MSTRQRFDIGTCNEKRNRKCSYSDHFTQAKKRKTTTIHAKISGRYERKRKCSFRDNFTPAKKEDDGNTRLEFGEGTCNDKRKGGSSFSEHFTPAEKRRRRQYTLRIRIRYERKRKCSLRDHFTPAKKGRRR